MLHRRPPTLVDWLVAVVVGLFAIAEEVGGRSTGPTRDHLPLWIAAGIAAAVAVLFRRRAPFAILFVYCAVTVPLLILESQTASAWQFYTELVLLFTLLSEVRPRSVRAAVGLAASGAYVAAMMSTSSPQAGWGDVAVAVVMSAIAAGAGLAVRRHRVLAVQAAERGELLAREAVAEERARIARELHDIVAHSVSVMTMQTGGVRLMLREDQERERQVLASIEETGRGAVDELRRMLGLLRGPMADSGPQAGLDRLDDLLDQVRAAGLDVTLEVRGDPVPLPAGLDLSAYRIVQEALTNALKHAGPTRAAVTVAYHPGELHLEITDHGPRERRARTAGRGAGHGLIGMRERAALFHGTLTAGPLASGGFGVRAVLPL